MLPSTAYILERGRMFCALAKQYMTTASIQSLTEKKSRSLTNCTNEITCPRLVPGTLLFSTKETKSCNWEVIISLSIVSFWKETGLWLALWQPPHRHTGVSQVNHLNPSRNLSRASLIFPAHLTSVVTFSLLCRTLSTHRALFSQHRLFMELSSETHCPFNRNIILKRLPFVVLVRAFPNTSVSFLRILGFRLPSAASVCRMKPHHFHSKLCCELRKKSLNSVDQKDSLGCLVARRVLALFTRSLSVSANLLSTITICL